MTNIEKKELFLQIIENWFNDSTEQINSKNCIGFYHYLIDCIEFESKYTLELEVGYHQFLNNITERLSELIYESPNVDITKKSILYSDNSIHPEQLDLFWGDMLYLYTMVRDEFLL